MTVTIQKIKRDQGLQQKHLVPQLLSIFIQGIHQFDIFLSLTSLICIVVVRFNQNSQKLQTLYDSDLQQIYFSFQKLQKMFQLFANVQLGSTFHKPTNEFQNKQIHLKQENNLQQIQDQLVTNETETQIPNTTVQVQLNTPINFDHNVFTINGKKKCQGLKCQYQHKIKTMKMGKSSQQCTICLEQFEKGQLIKKLPCGHILHRTCVKNWFKLDQRCPNCRFDLNDYFQKNGEL